MGRFALRLCPLLVLSLLVLGPSQVGRLAAPARAASSTTFYFHGTPQDQANGTGTFNQTAPTVTVPVTQTTSPFANRDFVGNSLAAFWSGPFSGSVSGNLELKWFWSTANAEATALGAEVQVSVFADPNLTTHTGTLIGRAFTVLNPITAVPTEFTSDIPVNGTVNSRLLIQVVPRFTDTGQGLFVHYDSVSTPSRFSFVSAPPQPQVVFDTTTKVAFAPSTVVSAHFLGAEPQTTLEHRIPGSLAGRLDPNRIFVDWPLTSRTQTSNLSRSLDGGDSFRLLFDPTCASRNRPNCGTAGGGDSEEDVSLYNGNLFFADQEALVVNEGLASSVDHGDSFPATREHAITNSATAVDRQWLAYADPNTISVAGGTRKVEAFLTYHIPIAGQFIVGIDQDGIPIDQPVPQITQVNQSGQPRVDNSAGPAHGWIYQPYRGPGGVTVATAFGPNYQLPTAWRSKVVSSDTASIFPWLAVDSHGNAYLVWVAGGQVYLSVSPIDDARNNPTTGRPGSFWTPQAKVNIPAVGSAVFPEVTAGDTGRVALTYMGSEDCTGVSDNCPNAAHWNTYAAIIPDALALVRGTPMSVATGKVNHRIDHRGQVCTAGTTCSGDRSLLDMTDIGFDESGRAGVVFMDNNNRLAAPNLTDSAKNGPFAEFAKETLGPSLLATTPDPNITIPENSRSDPAGDATWPNTAAGKNLPSLDLLGASVSVDDNGNLVARLPLKQATRAAMARDLTAYNNTFPLDNNAARLQYLVWFATADDVFHLSMEFNSDGTTRFFGGRLDGNDGVQNGTGTIVGARYATDSTIPVTGTLAHGAITLRAPLSALGLSIGSKLFSVNGFATAAPAESDPTAGIVTNSARTVDATPPFDATLQPAPQPPPAATVDCADADNVTTFGGWHVVARSGRVANCGNRDRLHKERERRSETVRPSRCQRAETPAVVGERFRGSRSGCAPAARRAS